MLVDVQTITLSAADLDFTRAVMANGTHECCGAHKDALIEMFAKRFGDKFDASDLELTVYPDGPVMRTNFLAEKAEFFMLLAEDAFDPSTKWIAAHVEHEGPCKIRYYNNADFMLQVMLWKMQSTLPC